MGLNNAKGGTSSGNRLVGWLVSYEMDKMGKAFEIRAGRTLISAENGKGRFITVADTQLSSPHMAISASQKHRVLVQDIFSDDGSFLTRSDADKESPINSPIEVGHGDWIRVGAKTRFQVCLIDMPAR